MPPGAADDAMIRLSELRFRHAGGEGDAGFELGISKLTVARGEHVAVIGPSGSGKTTLLHLVAGIVVPESGSVWTGGAFLSDLDDAARRAFRVQHVGLVFQEFELLDYLDVLDNILLPYRVHPSMRLDGAVRDRAIALARDVGLGDKLRRHPQRLSHGEKQRAAVCRALVTQPDLLLADEPTGNLDPLNKERVLEILIDHARATGATLVTVTHDHGMLKRFGRVIDFHSLALGGVEGASA